MTTNDTLIRVEKLVKNFGDIEVLKGIDSENGSYQIIDDRQEAIEYMLDNAKEDDIIALIGKGHEEYQEVNGEKFYFSEIEVIRNYMLKR